MIRVPQKQMQDRLKAEQLQTSAELYAEIYEADDETQELTEAALEGWPEWRLETGDDYRCRS